MEEYVETGRNAYDETKIDKRQGYLWGGRISNKNLHAALIYLNEQVPLKLIDFYSKITGNDKYSNLVDVAKFAYNELDIAEKTYNFFINGSWEFQS